MKTTMNFLGAILIVLSFFSCKKEFSQEKAEQQATTISNANYTSEIDQ